MSAAAPGAGGTAAKIDTARGLIMSGQLPKARAVLARAIKAAPNDPAASDAMRALCLAEGNIQQALFYAQKTAALAPNHPGALADAGALLSAVGRHAEALALIDKALTLEPGNRQGHFARVAALFSLGRVADALAAASEGLKHNPDDHDLRAKHVAAYLNLGLADLGVPIAAELLRAEPERASAAETLANLLNYASLDAAPPARTAAAHRNAGRLIAGERPTAPYHPPADPDRLGTPGAAWPPGKRLRVGFLSADFRLHSVAFFALPIVERLDRAEFDLVLYNAAPRAQADALTAKFRAASGTWRDAAGMPAVALAQGIAQDKLDVLVDLSGLTAGHRLDALAARPAPAMVTYLGYPHTTGLPGMDYRIVDAVTDPTNQTPAGTEALARLDPCFVCFRPPEGPPAPKAPPADAPTTFVSFNALTKLNDPLLRLWARVLAAAPRSRLLLKNRECYTPDVRAHLLARCAAAGMDPARVDIAEPTKGIGEHLAVYHRGAVALDSFPYGGTTTTCEALWMGLPVVTLAGPVHASRVGASLLNAAGLGHLVAHTEEEFVRIATEAAQADHARVRALVRSAFEASPAMDEHGFARRFGGLLKAIASTARA